MKVGEALPLAAQSHQLFARPVLWRGTACGLNYQKPSESWEIRDMTCRPGGTKPVSASRVMTEWKPDLEWEVVEARVLHAEARVISRKRLQPPLPPSFKDHEEVGFCPQEMGLPGEKARRQRAKVEK